MKKQCECCKFYTLDCDSNFDICPVCYWQDDLLQTEKPHYKWWANELSLEEWRLNFIKHWVSDLRDKNNVRNPYKNEMY